MTVSLEQLQRCHVAVDLGAARTRVYVKGLGLVVDEPSVAAVNTRTGSLIAVGVLAEQMTGRTPEYIRVVRPVSGGSVVDIEMAQRMLRHLLGDKLRRQLRRKPRLRAAACIPHEADPLAQRATVETRDSTEEGAGDSKEEGAGELLGRAVDELDSTIQEVRTAIFALQQPPAEAPSTFRGRVLRETGGASALLGFPPSVHFTGAVDALVGEEAGRELLAALRGALAAAHRRPGVSAIDVEVDATVRLPDGRSAVRLVVADDGRDEEGGRSTTVTWQAPI
ncbi:Cell shape-determining protein MreB [Streptomyces microflavus]